MTKPPKLPRLTLGNHILAIDSISGHGAAEATVSVHKNKAKPESRPVATTNVARPELTRFALELLDLSEEMLHAGTFASSTAFPDSDTARALIDRRRKDATQRYFKGIDRLPILQLCQRFLERCDDKAAQTLLMILAHGETHGTLPVSAKLDLQPAPNTQRGSAH